MDHIPAHTELFKGNNEIYSHIVRRNMYAITCISNKNGMRRKSYDRLVVEMFKHK